jgi:hypothetical protein
MKRLLTEDDVRPVMAKEDFAAPGIRQDLLGDPDCGPPLRVYLALTDGRLGAGLSAEDRWFNRYYWFLRLAHAQRRKFGYDAGTEDQLSAVLAEVAEFDVDASEIEQLEAAARWAR